MTATPEDQRLACLADFCIMDTAPDPRFDRITAMAADLFQVPMALVGLIDAERQWFKSSIGMDGVETPREQTFCKHVLAMGPGAMMVVEDAARDPRFADSPFVTGEPHIRFYAGAAITSAEGHVLGTLCVIDSTVRPRPDPAQLERLRTLAAMVMDHLELHRMSRMADERSRALDLAGRMSGVGSWRLDLRTGAVSWSDTVYEIHGVTREAYNPGLQSAIDFYHPEDRPLVEAFLEAVRVEEGDVQSPPLRLDRPDGDRRWVTSRARTERDGAGDPVGIFGVFQDVTAQSRASEELRRSERRFRLLTENASDTIASFDRRARFTYLSPAIERVLGYRPEELVGQPTSRIMHPEDYARSLETYGAHIASDRADEPFAFEYRAFHKDGRMVWLSAHPRAIRGATGEIVEFQDVVRDITEQKAIAEALQSAKQQAEAAAQAKSDFLANMSHELRTPLTSIIGFSGLAAAQPGLPDLASHFLQRVKTASQALLATVNDILDFSKLEAGQVILSPQATPLGRLTREVLELFTPQASAKNLRLDLELGEGCSDLVLMLDPDRVRQVLFNYVGNAIKFTEAGQVRLRTSYHQDTSRLRVEVIDTGTGVAAEKQDLLFQRFSQVDGSMSRRQGGTGLGLAICKGLIDAMDGEVGVTSMPGQGSCFWFEAPFACAARRREEVAV